MPKTSKDFQVTLNFSSTLEIKQALTAVGYFNSQKGEYAGAARNFVEQGYKAWLGRLSEKDRKEFDEILAKTKITVTK